MQIAFLDPPPAGFPNQDAVRQSVLGAFYEWARHFDTTTGVYTLNVSYQPRTAPIVGANTATIYGDTYLTVGSDLANGKQVVTTAFGLGFAAHSGVSPSIAPLGGPVAAEPKVHFSRALQANFLTSHNQCRKPTFDAGCRRLSGNPPYAWHRCA